MRVSVKSNIDEAIKKLTSIQRKQIPYATNLALNETVKQVKVGVERQLKKDIDRPTPFTQKAFKLTYSKKATLKASVDIKPIQAEYLKYQIFGGSRRARADSPVIIPRESQTNKYGNLPRRKLSGLKKRGKLVIAGSVALQSMKKANRAIAYFAKSAKYTKRFKFYERAEQVTRKVFAREFNKSLAKALRTAR